MHDLTILTPYIYSGSRPDDINDSYPVPSFPETPGYHPQRRYSRQYSPDYYQSDNWPRHERQSRRDYSQGESRQRMPRPRSMGALPRAHREERQRFKSQERPQHVRPRSVGEAPQHYNDDYYDSRRHQSMAYYYGTGPRIHGHTDVLSGNPNVYPIPKDYLGDDSLDQTPSSPSDEGNFFGSQDFLLF